jgi:hypothetical protein
MEVLKAILLQRHGIVLVDGKRGARMRRKTKGNAL